MAGESHESAINFSGWFEVGNIGGFGFNGGRRKKGLCGRCTHTDTLACLVAEKAPEWHRSGYNLFYKHFYNVFRIRCRSGPLLGQTNNGLCMYESWRGSPKPKVHTLINPPERRPHSTVRTVPSSSSRTLWVSASNWLQSGEPAFASGRPWVIGQSIMITVMIIGEHVKTTYTTCRTIRSSIRLWLKFRILKSFGWIGVDHWMITLWSTRWFVKSGVVVVSTIKKSAKSGKTLTGTYHDVESELIQGVLFIGIAGAETERGH